LRKLSLQDDDSGLQLLVLISQFRDGAGQLRDFFDAGFVGDCHLLDVAYLCRHDLTALRRRRTFRSDDTRLSLQWSVDFEVCEAFQFNQRSQIGDFFIAAQVTVQRGMGYECVNSRPTIKA